MPPPPRRAGADAGLPGVEERRQLRLGDHLVERIGHAVVREELLHRRMELEALAPCSRVIRRSPARTPSAPRCGFDAREGDRDVAVLVRELGDLLVGDLAAGLLRAVDGEDHERHLELAVHLGHLRHRLVLRLVAEVAPHRLLLLVGRVVHRQRGFPGVRMDVDGDELVELHGGSPAANRRTAPPPAPRGAASTARWLIEPLSVISPASSDGGSSSTSSARDAIGAAGAFAEALQPLAQSFGVELMRRERPARRARCGLRRR